MSNKPFLKNLPAIAGNSPVRFPDDFLVFGSPVLGDEEIAGVTDCLHKKWLGKGAKVSQFEDRFAVYKCAENAVAVSSGTAAIHLALVALGIVPGDEVITTAMTYCATINAIIHSGATPVLADCDKTSLNIDPVEIEKHLTIRTRAILVVHMCGNPCDMNQIMDIARTNKISVIEDCAHAIEATFEGTPVGTIGDIGCFSFYASKNITSGEGGMILTKDPSLATEIRILSNQGISDDIWSRFSQNRFQHHEVIRAGFKYNMTDLNAAIGLAQLEKIRGYSARRNEIWEQYQNAFTVLPCILPIGDRANSYHAKHLYTPLLHLECLNVDRDWILDALLKENIGVGVHFLPVHFHSYYQNRFGWKKGDYPVAEFVGMRTISLPLSPGLDTKSVNDVCSAFIRVILHYKKR